MATIRGSSSNDNLTSGTIDDDTFLAGLGSDYITGSAGNDIINAGYANSASYRRYGFNDFDTVSYRDTYLSYGYGDTAEVHVVVDLEAGTAQKFDAADTLLNVDTLIGVDAIWGGDGNDTLLGRNFWDYEEFRGYGGVNLIDGRGGDDGVNYAHADAGIAVDLAVGTLSSAATNVGSDTMRGIEIIAGTLYTDSFDATGYGASSVNSNSYGESWNVFSPLSGDDTIVGNGETIVSYAGVGGALSVDLSLQTAPGVAANIIVNFVDDIESIAFKAGNILASGVDYVRGGDYDDTLLGGGSVNTAGTLAAYTVSGDRSFEGFRGNGGDDAIDGRSGFDLADYSPGNQTEGIVVHLADGIVTGDPLRTGTDTLRGVESIGSTHMDDMYDAVGYTLSSAPVASINSGDVLAVAFGGEALESDAFNEFRAYGGNDVIHGNGATRISFRHMFVENIVGTRASVEVSFSDAASGHGVYGQTDGGLGSVDFSGVYSIRGGRGNDVVHGAEGYQHLSGYYGDDRLYGGDGADILYGHLGGSELALNPTAHLSDDDLLDGGAGNDFLRGDFGDDILIGGSGDDIMRGGTGDDVYHVDAAGDLVIEASSDPSEIDTVIASLSWTLGDNVERLVLAGGGAIDGTGNALANTLTGNNGANVLDGGAGADTMIGGKGNDNYWVDSAGDVVIESSTIATEIDTVRSSIGLALGANVENLILTGTDAINGTGNTLANKLIGNGAVNTLNGGAGDDVLDGGAGFDKLYGGTGNDIYVVDSVGDKVYETSNLATEIDTVRSLAGWTLGANLENLTLIGTSTINGVGNALANTLTGNAAANSLSGLAGNDVLNGGAGNDILDGGTGNDTMAGGVGNDTYYVDAAGDVVTETSALASEIDTVIASVNRVLGLNQERLTLSGSSALNGAGNALDNLLTGNAAANTLSGLDGNDVLAGGLGNDTLVGGKGLDTFRFNTTPNSATNADIIKDFLAADDRIEFDDAAFAGIGPAGALSAVRFHAGAAAHDASDRIIYNQAAGKLYFDADGNGAAAQVLVASLTPGTSLTIADLFVI